MLKVRRVIEPKMVEWLDKRVLQSGLALEAIAKKDPRTLMILAAQVCVGIREEGGNNSGPLVELIQETVGNHMREAWCMSFVQTLIAYADHHCGTNSPIFISEGCAQVWDGTDKKLRVEKIPAPGAIVIWGKYQGKKYLGGHTGIVIAYHQKDGYMLCIEGNTNSGTDVNGKIEREGGGVYFTKRHIKANGNMIVRGFLKPY